MMPSVRPCAPPSAGRCSLQGPAATAARHAPLKWARPRPRPALQGSAPSPSPRPARGPPLPEPRLADQGCAFPGNPGLAWVKSELPRPRPTRNRRLRDAGLDPPVGSGSSRLVRSAFRLAPRATVKLPPRRLPRARPELGWKQGNGERDRPRGSCTLLGETHVHHINAQHKCMVRGFNADQP